ncbi:MAG TPA: D-aminoacylase [Candidatus Limnocylindrales bacterium]|jgi:N-acyl-D-aspartate/D-glutamate deacylase
MAFDLVLRNGSLAEGSGAPLRPLDVGVTGDRITAVGDLSAVDGAEAAVVLDVRGLVVAPGFVDPHGHSDGNVLVDGALASHLHQGYTTQLSGNCGFTLAPFNDRSGPGIQPDLEPLGLHPDWRTFGEYLDAVDAVALGPNVAFLVGHGTVRGAVLGPAGRAPDDAELAAMVGYVDEAMDAGAIGLSSGLIYAPGIHGSPDEVATLVAAAYRRDGLYATHMRNESDGVHGAIEEAIATARRGGQLAGRPGRLQVSHLKAGARSVWGQGPALVERIERARAEGLDAAADQYPYTAASTTLATMLPPELLALDPEDAAIALRDTATRVRVRQLQASGISGWENVARDPGWDGVVIARSTSRSAWSGRSLGALADELRADPIDLALDVLADDRLAVDIVLHCMDEADVEAIMAIPWIAVCTDAGGRRPGHPLLDEGVPHPRAYGTTARVLGRYVRERGVLGLETAVAKLSAVPAARLGLADRGQVRVGWAADLVVFDPQTVIDTAAYQSPARFATGIAHVVVNGRLAIRDGVETGDRPGRLLRRA